MQTIYEVIGYTADIDWGSRSEAVSLGLFKSKAGADMFIDNKKKQPYCYMDWQKFVCNERQLQP